MDAVYWITRYLLAAGVLGAILVGIEYIKGEPTRADLVSAVAWAAMAGAIFIGSKYWNYRKARACSVCKDQPES